MSPVLGIWQYPTTAVAPNAQTGGLSAQAFFTHTPENVLAATIPLLPERLFSQNERIKQPMSAQWTLGVQYQFANDYVFKVEYVGTKGSNLVHEIEQIH